MGFRAEGFSWFRGRFERVCPIRVRDCNSESFQMTRTTTIVTDIVNKAPADNDSPSQATVRVQQAAKLIIFKQRVAVIFTSTTISLNVFLLSLSCIL